MMHFIAHKIGFVVIFLMYSQKVVPLSEEDHFEDGSRDGFLNFTQFAQEYNRQYEVFDIITEDGYILQLYHLIGDESKPVLMWHGLLGTADDYILRGLNSPAVEINDAGYDIWLGNTRGNKYSRRHVSLDPETDKKFWDFSINDVAIYDLPACIDFILKKTGQSQLSAIGHSMGNAVFYILGSTRPEYNEKVKILIALGPIAFLNNVRDLVRVFPVVWPVVNNFVSLYTTGEFLGADSDIVKLWVKVCSNSKLGYEVCYELVLSGFFGHDPAEMGPELFDVFVKHYPAGSSRKVVDHFAQIITREKFSNYDYGYLNLLKYGSLTPPDYDLSKVTMPIALLSGKRDSLATIEDVARLRAELPNVVLYKVMDRDEFNHIDFVYAKNVSTYIKYYLSILESRHDEKQN